MNSNDSLTPDGYAVVAVDVEDDGTFINVWDDGRRTPTSTSVEDAVVQRQRARSVATRTFLRRKRKPWLTHRI